MSVSRAFAKEVNKSISDLKLSDKNVETVCRAFLSHIIDTVKTGAPVTFKNTFSFKRAHRKDRTHKNPKTQEDIFKPAHYVLVMDMKKSLRDEFEKIPVVIGPGEQDAQSTDPEDVVEGDDGDAEKST